MDLDYFEELGKLGIVSVTLTEEAFDKLTASFYPKETTATKPAGNMSKIHTSYGEITINKEK